MNKPTLATMIDNPIFVLAFEIDLNDTNINCINGADVFIERIFKESKIDWDDEEKDVIIGDIILAVVFSVLSFLEKKLIKDEDSLIDEDLYDSFKGFYKLTAVAETKVNFNSDQMTHTLAILSSVCNHVKTMLQLAIENSGKIILNINYVNSKVEIENDKIILNLVLQIKTC